MLNILADGSFHIYRWLVCTNCRYLWSESMHSFVVKIVIQLLPIFKSRCVWGAEIFWRRKLFVTNDFVTTMSPLRGWRLLWRRPRGILTSGVDFTNFFRQATNRRCTAFSKNFAVQFHHHRHPNCTEICPIFWAEICRASAPFAESVRRSLSAICQKRLLILCVRKSRAKMLMKLTPEGSLSHSAFHWKTLRIITLIYFSRSKMNFAWLFFALHLHSDVYLRDWQFKKYVRILMHYAYTAMSIWEIDSAKSMSRFWCTTLTRRCWSERLTVLFIFNFCRQWVCPQQKPKRF